MRRPTIEFPTRSDTNQPVQSQKQAMGLKFWISAEEKLYYLCSENKGLISFAVPAKLVWAFGFAYADYWFSDAAAHLK